MIVIGETIYSLTNYKWKSIGTQYDNISVR